jgi:hypothetical protein
MVMNSSVLWYIPLYSPLKVNQRFGGRYRFHFQSRRISQTINQHEAGSKMRLLATNFVLVSCFVTLKIEEAGKRNQHDAGSSRDAFDACLSC